MIKQMLLGLLVLNLVSCGIEDSPPKEADVVGSEFNMTLSNLFICQKVISETGDATNYAALELSTTIKIVYSVFYGTNSANNEKVIRGQINSYYTDEGSAFNTEDFDANAAKYTLDIAGTSRIDMAMDLNDNSNGVWAFGVTINDGADNQPTVTYTDSDLAASPVTITFDNTATPAECSGSF